MPPASALSAPDEALLTARLVEYRSTPSTDKEAFRVACAKYIIRTRNLDDSNEYLIELFSAKVRNWFQNHSERQHERLPFRINQSFHLLRIFGHRNRDIIRAAVAELMNGHNPDNDPYIVVWNETVRRLWMELSEAEQQPYIHLAELWSVQGPDDDLKPWMAEKRAPAWMRAVGNMFWTQCGMPVFIYGMFKDTNGRLRATVYDTTELWADSKPDTPLFRNIKGWDQDFRRKAWTFFQAMLEPDQATSQTMEFLQATRRVQPATFDFASHADGTPILPKHESVKQLSTERRQRIFRDFLRMHYSHAMGAEARAVPWKSLHDDLPKFFEPGMWPAGIVLQDPSHINDDDLIKIYEHIENIEQRPDTEVNRFRFSHYEMGPKENRKYIPAVYSGSVAAAEPRRPKKQVQVPEFDGPPSNGDDGSARGSRPPPARPGPTTGTPGSRIPAALEADLQRVRAELAAKSAPSTTPSTPQPEVPDNGSTPAALVNDKGKGKAQAPWVDAEIDAAVAAAENDASEDDLEDTWHAPPPEDSEPADDLLFQSDDEVEGVLDFAGDAAVDGPISAVSNGAPEARHDLQSPPSPSTVAASAPERIAFLRTLALDAQYQRMLDAMEPKLTELAVIRGKSPVMWATWGHSSGHVPESVHGSEKNVASLLKWIQRGQPPATAAADIQRYCLVVGIVLSNLRLIRDTNGITEFPDALPGFLAYSQLDSIDESTLLAVCESTADRWSAEGSAAEGEVPQRGSRNVRAEPQTVADPVPAKKAGRGRGRTRGTGGTGVVGQAVASTSSTNVGRVTRARSRAR